MPLITKSRDSIWRVWSGPYSLGGKAKKRVGVSVAVSIRADKLPPAFSEAEFVEKVAALLVDYASRYDPKP